MINFKQVKVLCIEPERVRQLITQIEQQGITKENLKEISISKCFKIQKVKDKKS
jgi:hypothetical protein